MKKDAEKAEHEKQTPNSTHQLPCSHPEGRFQLFYTPRSLAVCGDTVDMWLKGEESVVPREVRKWAVSLPPPPFFFPSCVSAFQGIHEMKSVFCTCTQFLCPMYNVRWNLRAL